MKPYIPIKHTVSRLTSISHQPVPTLISNLAQHYGLQAKAVKVVAKPWPKAKPKRCYDNCWDYIIEHSTASYVLGYMLVTGLPVEHAWIKTEKGYIDISTDGEATYYALVELPIAKLYQLGVHCGYRPDLVAYWRFHRQLA